MDFSVQFQGFGKSGLMRSVAVSGLQALPLAVSAGLALTPPAAAQTTVQGNQASTVNLGNYASGQMVSITLGTTITVGSGDGVISQSAAWLANAGQVSAADGVGIALGAGGTFGNTGQVSSETAVQIFGGAGLVDNSGSIIGSLDAIRLDDGGTADNLASGLVSASRYGVVVRSAAGAVSNAGIITAGYDGISLDKGGSAVNQAGGTIFGGHIGVYTGNAQGSVQNAGQISATSGDAVSLYSGGSLVNTASGRLLGGYSGVYAGGNGASIQNAGLITGPDFGVYLTGASAVTNTGTISGGIDGIIAVGAHASLVNDGMIYGTSIGVRTAADSVIDNTGTISGGTTGVKLGADGTLTNAAGGLIQGGAIGLQAGNDDIINNAGRILDNTQAGIVLGNGDSLTNSGSIGGVTGILVTGSDTSIANTGVITATGTNGDAILLQGDGDTLELGTGSEINGAIAATGVQESITLAGTGTLTSDITGFGGTGALAIAQNADWTASGNWAVAQVTNDGTFQPGIIGTPLSLTGNFTQNADGTMQVYVTPGASTEFQVTGSVALAGALHYVLAPGSYEPTEETFLTASGPVTGAFTSVTETGGQTQSQPQTQQTQQPASQQAAQQNQSTGPTAPAASNTGNQAAPLALQTVGHSETLLVTQNFVVAPEYDTLFAQAAQAMTLDAERNADDLLGHATGAASPGCPAAANAGTGAANIAQALGAGFCKAGGWIEATGTQLNAAGYSAQTAGFLAGIDHTLATGTRIGAAIGYDSDRLTTGAATANTMRLGLYAAQPLGRLILAASLEDGLVSQTTARNTGAGTAAGKTSGNSLAAALQISRPASLGPLTLTPAAGLRISQINLGSFAETATQSAFALHAGGLNNTAIQPYLRLSLAGNFTTTSNITLTPAASIGVATQTGGNPATTLTAADGTTFTTTATRLNPTSAELSAGLTASRANWSLTLRYTATTAGNWTAQTAEGALLVRF